MAPILFASPFTGLVHRRHATKRSASNSVLRSPLPAVFRKSGLHLRKAVERQPHGLSCSASSPREYELATGDPLLDRRLNTRCFCSRARTLARGFVLPRGSAIPSRALRERTAHCSQTNEKRSQTLGLIPHPVVIRILQIITRPNRHVTPARPGTIRGHASFCTTRVHEHPPSAFGSNISQGKEPWRLSGRWVMGAKKPRLGLTCMARAVPGRAPYLRAACPLDIR